MTFGWPAFSKNFPKLYSSSTFCLGPLCSVWLLDQKYKGSWPVILVSFTGQVWQLSQCGASVICLCEVSLNFQELQSLWKRKPGTSRTSRPSGTSLNIFWIAWDGVQSPRQFMLSNLFALSSSVNVKAPVNLAFSLVYGRSCYLGGTRMRSYTRSADLVSSAPTTWWHLVTTLVMSLMWNLLSAWPNQNSDLCG